MFVLQVGTAYHTGVCVVGVQSIYIGPFNNIFQLTANQETSAI